MLQDVAVTLHANPSHNLTPRAPPVHVFDSLPSVGAGVMRPSTAPGELDTADVAKAEMSSATHAKLTSIVSFGDDRFQKVRVVLVYSLEISHFPFLSASQLCSQLGSARARTRSRARAPTPALPRPTSHAHAPFSPSAWVVRAN